MVWADECSQNGYALSFDTYQQSDEGTHGQGAELQRSPIHLLHRAGQCVNDIFDTEIKEADLTPRQLVVLITVAENEGAKQTAIVERTPLARAEFQTIRDRLIKIGARVVEHIARIRIHLPTSCPERCCSERSHLA